MARRTDGDQRVVRGGHKGRGYILMILAGVVLMPRQLAEPAQRSIDVQSVRYQRIIAPRAAQVRSRPIEDGGFVVHLDADGRPIIPDARTMQPAPAGRSAGDVELELLDAPGGGKMVVTDRRFELDSMAHRHADGHVAGACGRAGSSARER